MQPIIISRETGKIISAPVLSQEQRDQLWGQIVSSHIQRHPEMLQDHAESEATA